MMCTLSLRVYYHCYRTDCCCYHPQTSWVKPTENRTLVAELPVLGPAVPFDIVNSFYDFSGTSTYCGFLDSRLLLGNLQEPSGFDFYIDVFSFRQQYRVGFEQLAKATDLIGGSSTSSSRSIRIQDGGLRRLKRHTARRIHEAVSARMATICS